MQLRSVNEQFETGNAPVMQVTCVVSGQPWSRRQLAGTYAGLTAQAGSSLMKTSTCAKATAQTANPSIQRSLMAIVEDQQVHKSRGELEGHNAGQKVSKNPRLQEAAS